VFQSWDMLCGRLLPELGGSRDHLDVVGINYYWTNQWEWGAAPREDGVIQPLADGDPRRWSLSDLVRSVWERYGGEVMITETSHIGDSRGRWLREVAEESEMLLLEGTPIRGVCLYPILGMPEWHDPDIWTPMGLWDPACHRDPCGMRLICEPMLEALQSVRHIDELHRAVLADSVTAGLSARQRRRTRGQIAAE
jgi:Beta-glucosidase/6-phospho-beta-glucosidase/beta-galactosidase